MAAGGAERRLRYLTTREVAEAGRPLLSALGRVYDLGPLLRERRGGVTLAPLLAAVGTDVSRCFDPESGDPLPRVEPRTGQTGSRFPLGTPGGSQPLAPRSDGVLPLHAAWWRDPRLQVGRLTAAPRLLRLCNALTGQNCVIEVCGEEPVGAALRRARGWQEQLEKYTACYGGVPLNPHLSLEQNGIPDGTSELRSLRLDPKDFIPTVFLYFNDDAGSDSEALQ
ncbi:cytochrome b5 domain-containing protein 1-like [Tympanuchus pallidicinctus]|uniref:cytochrome b5 domain-containing protein 1-like n=1 Tax=Tympanuchus pallidicinctus TaxID=109042 RepID=UPI00228703D1|nr:cytochrome b5 domain-containing protein 1-like [Tympanuchus pallidicinctus]XP_052521352.1 cytochrome b5 domain-containing protein 1-like [Tympanuchus pallidicinctus]